ncbi:MAG: FRG domain-containing protein, partial [Desulfobacteraceae bacterium]|nr:FRG domain-containing protein [Desulfobacteraceae bacterium]
MEIKQIKSWSQFVEEIEHLRNFREESVSKTNLKVSEFLYRGQSDSRWKLETTLERLDLGKINLNRYYNF